MRVGEPEFLPVSAADAELMDPPVAEKLVTAAHHAGVAELRAQIVVPQIGVGVKVQDMQIRIPRGQGAHRAERDEMFAADQERELPVTQDDFRPLLNIGESLLRAAEAKLQIAAVKDAAVGEIVVLIGTVRFQTKALVPDGRGAEARARAVAGGGIKRRAEQYNPRLLVGSFAPDERFDIRGKHQRSTSSRASSRKAGR